MSFISADQILAHLVGDYIIQSDWMAANKTKNSTAAAVHAFSYSTPFLLFSPNIFAFLFIVFTHFLIDRFRLARFVVWAKNGYYFTRGTVTTPTGYSEGAPPFLAIWLLIIADNTLHLICNGVALKYL